MKLFISVKNNQPFEHPILESNFKWAFPDIDTENLPPEFARFTRHPQPPIGPYEVYQGVTYELDESGGYCDVHHVRNMTDQEKTEKQNQVKQAWMQANGFASWNFDEQLCSMQPPIPYPNDGQDYKWDEIKISWIIVETE